MKLVHLKRLEASKECVLGALFVDGKWICQTLENPWLGNASDISCIPTGAYDCWRTESPKYGTTYVVAEVEGRTHILFHWGNTADDTEGCILLGMQPGNIGCKRAVIHSKIAFSQFMQAIGGDDKFRLVIEACAL